MQSREFCVANAVESMTKQVKRVLKGFSKVSRFWLEIYYFIYYHLSLPTLNLLNLIYLKIIGNKILVLSLWLLKILIYDRSHFNLGNVDSHRYLILLGF